MNRVVVTGIGALTPIGNNVSEFLEGLKKGMNGIDDIQRFDTSDGKVSLSAELKNFDISEHFDKMSLKRLDRFTQYALIATKEAMEDSGIMGKIEPADFSVYYGSGVGGLETLCEGHETLRTKGPKRVSPMCVPKMILNMAAGNIALTYNAKGTCLAVTTACATGTTAIGEAYRAIKHGYTKASICGGAEAVVTPLAMAAFVNCQALSLATDKNAGSVPFDKRRKGFIMGEAAGTLILEEYEHAKARGAKIYGEVVGYGATCDAHHITAPSPDTASSSKAIIDAKAELGDMDWNEVYFNAHGTGTAMNDAIETQAIITAFGETDAKKLHISSTKSMTGHTLGAAGAIEGIAVLLAMKYNFVPPTINLEEQDEACTLNYTPLQAVDTKIEAGLSLSLGFGGHNACVAFRKID